MASLRSVSAVVRSPSLTCPFPHDRRLPEPRPPKIGRRFPWPVRGWLGLALSLLIAPWTEARVLGYHVEDFFRAGTVSPPALSPDGSQAAFVTLRRGRPTILVHLVDGGDQEVFHVTRSDDDIITTLAWHDSDRLIYQVNFGDLVAQNTDLTNRQVLHSALDIRIVRFMGLGSFSHPQLLSTLPREPDHVLIQAQDYTTGRARVYRANVHTGESTLVQGTERSVHTWFADANGEIRMALELHRNQVRYLYRPNANARWRLLDQIMPLSDDGRFSYSGRTLAGRRHAFLGFSSDPDSFYFSSNVGRETTALYRFNARTADWSLLAEDPEYDIISTLYPQSHLLHHPATGELAGIWYHRDRPHPHWFDPAFAGLQKRVDQHLPDSVNTLVSMDLEERRFIFHETSSRHKGVYHLYDRHADAWEEFARVDRRLRPEDMSPMRPIRFTGSEGHPLHGYLTVPAGKPADHPRRLVLLIHGGPWIRDAYGYHPEVQFLAHHGFAVLQVNFRGSTGYGFSHLDALRRDIGAPAVRDLLDGVDWAINEGHADRGRIAVMGASYGAFAALQLMTTAPEQIRCGIAIAGVYDLLEHLRHVRRVSPFHYDFWQEMTAGAWNRGDLRRMSPIGRIDRLQAPLFLAHGDRDTVAPLSQSKNLAQALRSAGKDHDLLVLEGHTHHGGPMRNVILLYDRILHFLNEHLPES